MRKNDSEMLLVYVDGTYANSYVKIGSSSVPLSSLRSVLNWKHCPRPWKPDLNPKSSIQHLLKSTLIRGKEEENMFMSKYNSDILESFSEEYFLDALFFSPLRPVLLFDRTRYWNIIKKHAAHIAHVVEANYSSEMFLQNLDILGEVFKMILSKAVLILSLWKPWKLFLI